MQRAIAIVVDDLNIEQTETPRVREAIQKFLSEDLTEGDLTALITTRGGMGVYSQFTIDRALLREAAAHLVWSRRPSGRDGSDYLFMGEEMRALQSAAYGAILGGIRAMRDMPGRKSIVLISAGSVVSPQERMLQGLADEAFRSGVTVYPIIVRSKPQFNLGEDGEGEISGRGPTLSQIEETARREQTAWLATGDMSSLAHETGGLQSRPGDSVRESLARALQDQSAYYLLGYNPGPGSFDRKFHRIQVSISQAGLLVRTRGGYLGEAEPARQAKLESSARRLITDLLGVFQKNELHTRLTAAFRADGGSPRILSQVWIDGKDLDLQLGADGLYHTEFEVAVASFDPQGAMQEHTEHAYRTNLSEAQLAEARRSGLLYSISYAALHPGPYQVRVAVREKRTEHVGTATHFLIAPDVRKNQLALSGIRLRGVEDAKRNAALAEPWLALLRLGQGIDWEAEVFHPKLKKGEPNLMLTVRLFRDGDLLRSFDPLPVPWKAPLKKKQMDLPMSGALGLSNIDGPGEYVLQLLVADQNDRSKTVSQSIVFQVAP